MRGGLIIETLTHLALALTRWAWFALIVFVIFGAHAFIWGTTSTTDRGPGRGSGGGGSRWSSCCGRWRRARLDCRAVVSEVTG
jgi:hypothetical protein